MVEKSEMTPGPNDLWSQLYRPIRQFGERVAEFFQPSSDASSAEEYYEINIELPGVSEDEITVEVHDRRLTVSGEKKAAREEKGKNFYFSERSYGMFRRVFQLPADADAENVSATHKDGLLCIKVAKQSPDSPQPKRIQITRT